MTTPSFGTSENDQTIAEKRRARKVEEEKRRLASEKHDSMCVSTYVQAHTLTLIQKAPGGGPITLPPRPEQTPRHCWCMCKRCWSREGFTAEGHPRGRCICRYCPCTSLETALGGVFAIGFRSAGSR